MTFSKRVKKFYRKIQEKGPISASAPFFEKIFRKKNQLRMSSRFFIKTFSKILEETKILTKKHDFYILDRGKALILPFSRSKNRRFLLFFRRFLGAFRCNNQQTQKNEIRPCFEPKTSKKVTFRRFRHLNCVW